MKELTLFDRFVGFFSPRAAARRAYYRAQTQILINGGKRGYEGASRGPRTSGWRTSSSSANAEIQAGAQMLRDRARDLVRNNAYAARGKAVIVANTVGDGIVGQITAPSDKSAEKLSDRWSKWAETFAIDADGRHNIYGLQALAMGAKVESGEYFIRRRRRRSDDGFPVPLQVQFLESDFLDTTKNGETATGYIEQGIEFDRLGRRIAYWFYQEHPGSCLLRKGGRESVRVPEEDVIHGFRMDRPGQIRGVSWFAPIMIPLRDLDEYQDAALMSMKMAACFAIFRIKPEDEFSKASSRKEKLAEEVYPGAIIDLPPGYDVKTAIPNSPGGYVDFVRSNLQRVATGLGVPYEVFADLANVNFSSGKMGWNEFNRAITNWRWHILIPQMLDRIFEWFLEAMAIEGIDITGVEIEWTPPRRDFIDPTGEAAATRDMVRAGLLSLPEAVKQLGYDPKKHFEQIAETNAMLDKLGLVFDSDPRKVTKIGIAQNPEAIATFVDGEAPSNKEPAAGKGK
jgi:lambda family phage portal protein